MQKELLTPSQAARALDVSESSVRRWCDQGRLVGERTAGGHRRFRLAALLDFARQNGIRVSGPGAYGARGRGGREASVEVLEARARRHALEGDHVGLRFLVADVVGAGRTIAFVCDQILAPALHAIGNLWSTGEIDVYQEHRATATIDSILANAADLVATPGENAAIAVTCALSADLYGLAPRMASLVVREAGLQSIHLGPNTPEPSVAAAITDLRPALIAVSVSHLASQGEVIESLLSIAARAREEGALLALGGAALGPELRSKITADFFGDTMEHLSSFARRIAKRSAQTEKL